MRSIFCVSILKPDYLGYTVNFRTSQKSYKDTCQKNAPEDWLIFEHTHEAIIDQATWERVQEIRQTVRRTDTTGEANSLNAMDLILLYEPERIHTLVPGVLLLRYLMDQYGAQAVTVSHYGVREGYENAGILEVFPIFHTAR